MRFKAFICSVSFVWLAAFIGAQQPQPGEQPDRLPGGFDAAAVERGKEVYTAQCGFCHGSSARGGARGPDLTRSALVQEDEDGKQLGAFLKVGRPDRGMPPFELNEQQNSDLAVFLHSEIYLAANRRFYRVLDIVTGDAKAGEAFFNGAGKCSGCHSVAGDLKGVGAKYDPPTLQVKFLNPRTGRGGGGGGTPTPAYLEPNSLKVRVTAPSGQTFEGNLVRLTDFDVTLYDRDARELRSWTRNGTVPKVVVTDPLQAHLDMWKRWTDDDMHNMTAFLTSLK